LLGLGWLGLGRMSLGRLPLLGFLVRLWLPWQWVLWLWQWLPWQWQRLSREWLSEWTGRRASSRGTPFRWIRRWKCRFRRKTSGWSTWRSRTASRTRWDYGRSRTFGRINRLLGASTWCAGNEIRLRGNSNWSKPYEPSRNNFVLGTPNGRGSANKVHIRLLGTSTWCAGNEIRFCGNSSWSKPYEPSRNNLVLGTPNGRGSASKVHIHVVCSRGWPVGSPAGCRSVFKLVGC
jgi:hypothetical protein